MKRLFALCVLGSVLPAQNLVYESLNSSAWTNTYGGPYITRDVADSNSYFGKVVRVNYIWWLEHLRAPMVLQPGSYRATFTIRKESSTIGRFDIETYASFAGKTVRTTTPAAAQAVDTATYTKQLQFTVTGANTSVSFGLRNLNTLRQKRGYRLDSFALDQVEHGRLQAYLPLHTFSSANPAFERKVPSGVTGTGEILQLHRRGLWLFRAIQGYALPTGRYIARFRFRKTVSTAGRQDMRFRVNFWNAAGNSATKVIAASAQTVGRWQTVTLPFRTDRNANASAIVESTTGEKFNYEFAEFSVVRDGMYAVAGGGCISSGGVPTIQAQQPPLLGRPFSISLTGLPANSAAVMYHGDSNLEWGAVGVPLPLDLTAFGMPGCRQFVSTEISIPFRTSNTGTANWGFTMPSQSSFLGLNFYNQAAILDPRTNALGLVTTNYGHGVVGN